MKFLIDMNLSPNWVEVFNQAGWQASHWISVGKPDEKDSVIMGWAHANGYIVFTNDLDFGAILATTKMQGPSVIQVRTQDVMPQALKQRLLPILQQYASVLENGALVTIDENKARIRILPFSHK